MARQNSGNETEQRLTNWRGAQPAAERLAGHILRFEKFESINPSQPLGGPDGLKDILCKRAGELWVGASYFTREPRNFPATKRKFKDDLKGVEKNGAKGIAFVTNQRLSEKEKTDLQAIAVKSESKCEIFHLESLISHLDSPLGYGIRLEFLEVEMSRDEQTSFIQALHLGQETQSMEVRERLLNLEQAVKNARLGRGITEELEALKRSVASFYPDPFSQKFIFHQFLGHRSQPTSEQLLDIVNTMCELAKVLPIVSQHLPQVTSLLASLSDDDNSHLGLFLSSLGTKSQAKKVREGIELLERLAKVQTKLNKTEADDAISRLQLIVEGKGR